MLDIMGVLTRSQSRSIAAIVRQRIERGGERLWRFRDFPDLQCSAVAQALSRMTKDGAVERLYKGVYYRARETAFGKSRPSPTAVRGLAWGRKAVFPSGLAAANLLGFTTQAGSQDEVATTALSLPRLVGSDPVIHTRRPRAWETLSAEDAALLDFLRNSCKFSELGQEETIRRTLRLLSENQRFDRLLRVAGSEPPRVRAVLGALGECIGVNPGDLRRLRTSLNPLSRFDFGLLAGLPDARLWQAKGLHDAPSRDIVIRIGVKKARPNGDIPASVA